MNKAVFLAPVLAFAATGVFASIPPAYEAHLPPQHVLGTVPFISGGETREELEAVKRAAQEWPLEIVFAEQDGKSAKTLAQVHVVITDKAGKVVFDGVSSGPVLLVGLPRGEYTVTTHWDAWDFSRPVTIGDDRARVVFDWKRPEGAA